MSDNTKPSAPKQQASKPYPSVVSHPNEQSSKAIADFIDTGAWPEPGTLPVRVAFRKRFC